MDSSPHAQIMALEDRQQPKAPTQNELFVETTPLLVQSNDYRGFMNTDEEDSRHSLAKKTPFGEVRNVKRMGWVEWVFLVMATLTMLGLLGISIERFINIHGSFEHFTPSSGSGSGNVSRSMYIPDGLEPVREEIEFGWVSMEDGSFGTNVTTDCDEWTCLNDFVFAVLLLLNLGFCAFYCYDGILRERPFEMIGYAVGMFVIMVYVIINYSLEGNQGDPTRLIRLVLVIVVCPQSIVLAFVVQYRMGYLILNTIGSNQSLTRAYHLRSLFITVQRFNLQVLANIYVLSWAKSGHFTVLGEKIVLPLLFVYMVMVAYVGWTAVTWELKVVSVVWYFLIMPSLGYFVYKIVNVAVHWKLYMKNYTEYYINGSRPDVAHFTIDATVIIVLSVLGLLCLIVVFILMFFSMNNFGKGLKDRLPPPCLKQCCREADKE